MTPKLDFENGNVFKLITFSFRKLNSILLFCKMAMKWTKCISNYWICFEQQTTLSVDKKRK